TLLGGCSISPMANGCRKQCSTILAMSAFVRPCRAGSMTNSPRIDPSSPSSDGAGTTAIIGSCRVIKPLENTGSPEEPIDLLALVAAFAHRHGVGLNDPVLVDRFLADAGPRLKAA